MAWVIDAPAGATSLSIPKPPTVCGASVCTGTGNFDATLLVHKGELAGGRIFERYSYVPTCVTR